MGYSLNKVLKTLVVSETKKRHFMDKNEDLGYIKTLKNSIEIELKKVYKNVTGNELNLPKIDVKIDNSIKSGKIAGFDHPKDSQNGLLGVKEKALNDKEYLKWVITHELIHACIGKDLSKSKEHIGLFKKIADKIGLPKKYQD